ncbi:hypothetical protein [Pseudonocardia alaniniphila]|uniref:Transmembrane protein PGPGW n=1 Tax=Pseudonocardia alaniniphila TaxID=75291 RepID=A0ABS9TMT1_9PSEU|nr:hypothetical protein [Pseudonocardia alaniniphila]MCH6169850.1 hypothetical protein [Pseudonocardia alaniniphila]
MWSVTGWVFATWLKITLLLALAVLVAALVFGTGSGWFWLATAAAVLAELYVIRQLAREWGYEARLSWWWSR